MHADTMREKLFTVRMSDEERERAEALAVHHGLNVAGLIRMLLKAEERRIAAELPPPAKRPTKKAVRRGH